MNFLSSGTARKLAKAAGASGLPVVLSGDISDGPRLEGHLRTLAKHCGKSVYFVPGNHDFYHSSFEDTDRTIRLAEKGFPHLVCLSHLEGAAALTDEVGIVGPDGWCDGRTAENLDKVPFGMNDFNHIREIKVVPWDRDSRHAATRVFQAKAAAGVKQLERQLTDAVKRFGKVVIVTHAAPFPDMDTFKSALSPFYVWKGAGDFILSFAAEHPDVKFLCLSGHTHCRFRLQAAPNVLCASNGAVYYNPRVTGLVMDDLTVTDKE